MRTSIRFAVLSSLLTGLVALADTARAQTAGIALLGSGCTTPEGTCAMSNRGLPVLGQSFDLVYTGPNHLHDSAQTFTQPSLVIGFTLIGPVAIPQTLFRLQPAGCQLGASHDVVVPMMPDPLVRPAYESSVTISIPNDPIFLGGSFFGQWLASHVQCGFAGCGPVPEWIGTSETAICSMGL